MSLKIGIVGLPNVGKSTLFNALTGRSVPAENYPFCTIDPSVGIVPVPDRRLTLLSRLSKSEKTIPAVVEFTDIAGLVKGASEGEGLGNRFLSHIREVDAILEVVRVFEDKGVTHVHGGINPLHDIEVINLELILADFQAVSKRKHGLEKEIRACLSGGARSQAGSKEARQESEVLGKLEEAFEAGKMATEVLGDEERNAVKHLHLLTLKPILYVLNAKYNANSAKGYANDTKKSAVDKALGFFTFHALPWIILDIHSEKELAEVPDTERAGLRAELGLSACYAQAGVSEKGLDELIVKSYELLGLITFFTTGPKETRGWTIKRGSTAPEAGAAIHTDFRDKFIRAQVVFGKGLVEAGSFAVAREKGIVRTEGKEYIIQDGDVVEFRI